MAYMDGEYLDNRIGRSAMMLEEKAQVDPKRAKFRELAEKRTNKALDAIRLIGNLSNKQTYTYEAEEVRKIIKALRDSVSEVEGRFGTSSSRGGEFKL